jgi:lysophospholipase L1-like esterase
MLDLVTIMLGTNDLKRRFGLGASISPKEPERWSDGPGDCGPNDGAPQVLLMARRQSRD